MYLHNIVAVQGLRLGLILRLNLGAPGCVGIMLRARHVGEIHEIALYVSGVVFKCAGLE